MSGREPSRTEVVLFWVITFLVQIYYASKTIGWRARAAGAIDNIDNRWYMELADLIGQWKPVTNLQLHHFWGYPYFIVAVSRIFHLSSVDAMIAISMTASLVTSVLIHRLYGGIVAMALAMVSATWILLSVFGGCEPLFLCLLLAGFLAVRKEQWVPAAIAACVAATVRPIGVLMPLSLLAHLAWRRSWSELVRVTAVCVGMGAAYLIPVYLLTGDALVQPKMYSEDWQTHQLAFGHEGLLTIPFLRIWQSFDYLRVSRGEPWTMWIQSLGWVMVACAGTLLLWKRRHWQSLTSVERLFGCLYSGFLVCYNFDHIAMYTERFLLPVLPLMLFALRSWFPSRSDLRWSLAAASVVLNTILLFHANTVLGFSVAGLLAP